MLPRRPAPEILPADDDRVLRLHLPGLHEPVLVRAREPDQRVGAELLVLVGVRRDEGEELGGDDLVRVDVVADDVAEAVEGLSLLRLGGGACDEGGGASREGFEIEGGIESEKGGSEGGRGVGRS